MTTTTQTTDIASIKAAVIAAMAAGIRATPFGDHLQFGKPMRDALAAARHLGTVTYEDVEAANLPYDGPALSRLDARRWPASDVTCLLDDEGHLNLVWLHAGRGAGRGLFHVFGRNQHTGEWLLLPTYSVQAGRLPRPAVGLNAGQVRDLEEVINVTACAMDAMAVALARPAAEALTGPAGEAA